MPPRKSTRKKSTKRRSSTQKGRGLVSDIHDFVKENQLLSKGTRAAGFDKIANVADQLGYGRRKKRATVKVVVVKAATKKRSTRKKTQRGRGLFDSIGGVLGSIGHGIGSGGYGLLSGLTGGGRRSTTRKNVLKFK